MDDGSFPGLTQLARRRFCCCLSADYVPSLNAYFWGSWGMDLAAPCAAAVLAISSLLILVFIILPTFAHPRALSLYFCPIFALFCYSYFRTIKDGPGYLPFYWSAAPPRDPLSGVVSSDRQLMWLQGRPDPPRSIFSPSARRFVLRPDRECCYMSGWIAKRNYKFFILLNVSGFCYLSAFAVSAGALAVRLFQSRKRPGIALLLSLFLVLAVNFASMNGYFAFVAIKNSLRGVTDWELTNEKMTIVAYDRGKCTNLADVCGPLSIEWCCPTSPWSGLSAQELSMAYVPYAKFQI
jgi:hypothetical protein